MVCSTEGVSLGSAALTSAGPWPCALGSVFPLFAPLITWGRTLWGAVRCATEALCILLSCV